MVLKISEMTLTLGITNARSSNPAFPIDATIYVRFGLLRSCLYMRTGGGSFNDIRIYSSTYSMIVAESISIEIVGKTSLK